MASGNSLWTCLPLSNQAPTTSYATADTRGTDGTPVLDFDDTSQEVAVFGFIMPRHYSGGGITVAVTWAATSALTGTGGWDVAIERVGTGQQDIDASSFATAQTITAATVDGTSGNTKTTSVNISNGANMDSIAVGEYGRIRFRRDVANDTAVGDLEFVGAEIRET